MKAETIHWESDEDVIHCPVTKEVILDETGHSLSEACLFYYTNPGFDVEFKNDELKSKFNEYLEVLDPDVFIYKEDRELTAIKLLLKELDKDYKDLLLYSVLFTVSTATDEYASYNFCINMSCK
jgi:hypothetical protein